MAQMRYVIPVVLVGVLPALPAAADVFFFSSGNPDGKIATATEPTGSVGEIESADDFALTAATKITSATFTGLLPANAPLSDITEVIVEIYRVFPNMSDTSRTSGPPTFSTAQVPTRVNSPSDVALASRDSTGGGGLTFAPTLLNPNFTANNSVQPGGIHPKPGQTTGGNGTASGEEVQFGVTFTEPFILPADHYFFVPQVELTDGDFLWLSAARPIDLSSGTPFPPGFTDLQSWTRDAALDPDWLRVGTDIVGAPVTGGPAPTFNEAFSLTGSAVPELSTWAMLLTGFAGLGLAGRYRRTGKARAAVAENR